MSIPSWVRSGGGSYHRGFAIHPWDFPGLPKSGVHAPGGHMPHSGQWGRRSIVKQSFAMYSSTGLKTLPLIFLPSGMHLPSQDGAFFFIGADRVAIDRAIPPGSSRPTADSGAWRWPIQGPRWPLFGLCEVWSPRNRAGSSPAVHFRSWTACRRSSFGDSSLGPTAVARDGIHRAVS